MKIICFTIIAFGWLALSGAVGVLHAQHPDTLAAPIDTARVRLEDGLMELPDYLRDRWESFAALEEPEDYSRYIEEGEAVIRALGELIETLDYQPPVSGEEGYEEYRELNVTLTNLLDRVLLAALASAPVEQLQALVGSYQRERLELTAQYEAERKNIIGEGEEVLQAHQQDPFFHKYTHRGDVLAGLQLRLTELAYQQRYELFLDETDAFIERLNELSGTDPAAIASLKPPEPDYGSIIDMYKQVATKYPTSEYADDALYNMAYLTGEASTADSRAEANRLFEELVLNHPRSEYRLNAMRRIGEHYFMPPVNNIERAIEIYTQIALEFPESEYLAESLYKLGWCEYRLNRLPEAVEYFALALDETYLGGVGEPKEGTVLDIASESFNYIGICYSTDPNEWEGAGVENLALWLDEHPERFETYGRLLISQLGDVYHKIGQYHEAVDAYRKFIELFALDSMAPLAQSKVVDIYQKGDIYDPEQAVAEKIRYFATYNPYSEWWRANDNEEARSTTAELLESHLDAIIDETLVLAADNGEIDQYPLFENYSRLYIRFWPNGPKGYKVHYNLATVLERNLHRPTDAIREYWQVATNYADTSNRDIACQRVVAIAQELVRRETAGDIYVSEIGESLPPISEGGQVETEIVADTTGGEESAAALSAEPLLHSEQMLLASFDLYLGFFPSHPLSPAMLYQGGELLFRHNTFPESRIYLEKLIAEHAGSRYIEDAYTLILEGYFKTGDFAAVEALAAEITAADVSDDLKQKFKRRKAESVYLTATEAKKKGDNLAAAEEFLRVANETPDYLYADRSLYLAGLEFKTASAWERATDAFFAVVNRHPESEFADQALYAIGFILQNELNDPAGAAAVYERLVANYPKSDLAQSALANASINYNQLGDHAAAVRTNELYVRLFPNAEDASVYLFENAGHYLNLGDVSQANDIYRRFALRFPDDPRTIQAYFERGKYYFDRENFAQALSEFTNTVDAHERAVSKGLPGSPRYASEALAVLLDQENKQYDQLRLTLPESSLAAAKQRKKEWRNAMVEKYGRLIRLGMKSGYPAFYMLGKLDQELADAVFNQEAPEYRQLEARITAVRDNVDESIILNQVAVQTYRQAMQNLDAIHKGLQEELIRKQNEYDAFNLLVTRLQKEKSVEGVTDSLAKLNDLRRMLTEIDSAIIVSALWRDKCRDQIPEVAFRNGVYLERLWNVNIDIQSDEKDEELRLLFRQEVLNSAVAPLTPEICGFYLQSYLIAKNNGLEAQWKERTESAYTAAARTMLQQFKDQLDVVTKRIDRYITEYALMLPNGEDAQSPEGFYPEEMGGLILDQIDYFERFNTHFTQAFAGVFDTTAAYPLPRDYGTATEDELLSTLLNGYRIFDRIAADARSRKEEYAEKYNQTGELQWDDAAISFEDVSINCADYGKALLKKGFDLRSQYAMEGEPGTEILKLLVELEPETYAHLVGIKTEQISIVSDDSWRMWHSYQQGYDQMGFDDRGWTTPGASAFPPGVGFGKLDSLGAQSLWFVPSATDMLPGAAGLSEEERLKWVETDSIGARRYWFRRSFEIGGDPAAADIWLTADDDFSLFINGVYIAADDRGGVDWMNVKTYEVGNYLRKGENVIALEAVDTDSTGYGFRVGLTCEVIPDLRAQLAAAIDRKQEILEEPEPPVQPAEATEAPAVKPSERELREMRFIEKNKLK